MFQWILKPSIKKKLAIRFGILVAIFSMAMILTFIILNKSIAINNRITYSYNPAIKKLEGMKQNVVDSRTLINTWISTQSDDKHPEKTKLKNIINVSISKAKDELKVESTKWERQEQLKLDTLFKRLDSLLIDYGKVMNRLNTFDSYNDPTIVMFEINPMVQDGGSINVSYDKVIKGLNAIITINTKNSDIASNEMTMSLDFFKYVIIVILIITIITGILITIITVRNITIPINRVKDVLEGMGKGILPDQALIIGNDEIGEMSAMLNHLNEGLRSTAAYADKIGNGVLDAHFSPLSDKDILGTSLLEMGKKLRKVSEEDGKRNWVTTGLANFTQLLRESGDLQVLCDSILSSLVKYVGANQGALYLMGDEMGMEEDVHLKLVSHFAYNRKKFREQIIYPGDGLVGQCLLEQDTIFITDVPENYVTITSGLGEATPRCVAIFPLVYNDKIMGVLELASFKVLDTYETEFIKKLCENIASIISSGRINERTVRLLEDSKLTQQSMQEKEEEMKQNLEELTATQEEMKRKEESYLKKIQELESKLTLK